MFSEFVAEKAKPLEIDEAAPEAARPPWKNRGRALVVCARDGRKSLFKAMHTLGLESVVFECPYEAMKSFMDGGFDLVLLDPYVIGSCTLACQIKKEGPDLPVLMVVEKGRLAHENAFCMFGFDALLSEPVKSADLEKALAR